MEDSLLFIIRSPCYSIVCPVRAVSQLICLITTINKQKIRVVEIFQNAKIISFQPITGSKLKGLSQNTVLFSSICNLGVISNYFMQQSHWSLVWISLSETGWRPVQGAPPLVLWQLGQLPAPCDSELDKQKRLCINVSNDKLCNRGFQCQKKTQFAQ